MTDKVLMLILLISGLILAAGVTFQLVTGMRMRRPRSQSRRKSHKVIGYSVIVLSLLHLPLGVLDFWRTFMK